MVDIHINMHLYEYIEACMYALFYPQLDRWKTSPNVQLVWTPTDVRAESGNDRCLLGLCLLEFLGALCLPTWSFLFSLLVHPGLFSGFGWFWWSLPSGKLTFCYGKIHHVQWENPLLMVIFNSYVSHNQRVSGPTNEGTGTSSYGQVSAFVLGPPWVSQLRQYVGHLASLLGRQPRLDGRLHRFVVNISAMNHDNDDNGQSTIYRWVPQ